MVYISHEDRNLTEKYSLNGFVKRKASFQRLGYRALKLRCFDCLYPNFGMAHWAICKNMLQDTEELYASNSLFGDPDGPDAA